MKRFLVILLMGLMVLALMACTNNNHAQSTESQSEIENSENDVTEQEEDKVETYWIKGTTVNFRKEPDTNADVIGLLARGTEILKIGEVGDWLYISCGEEKGYIHKDYASNYLPVNSVEGEVYIIVKKSERLLELWQGETLIISVPIGLGFTPEGHKQIEGDGKTPEGEYYVCIKNYNSAFYLSLGLSYPNKDDAAAALADGRIDNDDYERIVNAIHNGQQPDWYTPLGGEIMIHGHGGTSDWTSGCVAVDNEVMDILFEYCRLRTKVTILPYLKNVVFLYTIKVNI